MVGVARPLPEVLRHANDPIADRPARAALHPGRTRWCDWSPMLVPPCFAPFLDALLAPRSSFDAA